ncbi:MAG: RHS repeat-associated core domain-containing protein [Fibrobacter sp.]|nr:RHS repeat-associated core domain-containing protein [Fibrobacter sp.]
MVVDDKDMLAGAYMYQPYGTIDEVVNVSLDRVREKFTGKEFDEEGAINGAPGLRLEYFGKRYYNPEVGIFISTDPEDQYWNAYAYCGGDPVNSYDPDGSFAFNPIWLGQVIGLATGATIGGIIGGISAHERGGNVGFGIFGGALIGGGVGGLAGMGIGAGIESGLFNQIGSVLGASLRSGLPIQTANAAFNIAHAANNIMDNATRVTLNDPSGGGASQVDFNRWMWKQQMAQMEADYLNQIRDMSVIADTGLKR